MNRIKVKRKIELPAPGIGFGLFLGLALVGWLTWLAGAYGAAAAAELGAAAGVSVGLRGLSALGGGVLMLAVGLAGWRVGVKAIKAVWPAAAGLFSLERETVSTSSAGEAAAGSAGGTMGLPAEFEQSFLSLERALLKLDADRAQSSSALADAKTQATVIVKLTHGFAEMAEEMAERVEILREAQTALDSGEPRRVAEAAGYVGQVDADIAALMRSRSADGAWWAEVQGLVAQELGTLRGVERTYRSYAVNLLKRVAETRVMISRQETKLNIARAGRPLLEMQAQLNEAAGRLAYLRLGDETGPVTLAVPEVTLLGQE